MIPKYDNFFFFITKKQEQSFLFVTDKNNFHKCMCARAGELSLHEIFFSNVNWNQLFLFHTRICVHKHHVFWVLLVLIMGMFSVFLLRKLVVQLLKFFRKLLRCKSCYRSSLVTDFLQKWYS